MLPKLIDLGPVPIHTYGVLLVTALLVSISLTAYLAESQGIPRKRSWDLGFVIILSSVIGAKLLLVITLWDYYMSQPGRLLSLEFLQAGGVYYGGLLGAIIGAYFFVRANPDLSFLPLSDAAAPAIPLGQSIGRLGCFAAGCDYGYPTDVPWAVTFTSEYANRVVGVPLGIPLHPYQLYEAGADFLLFLFLLWKYRSRKFKGQIFLLYILFYSVIRFFLEFFRGDIERGFAIEGLVSTSQFISLLMFPAALIAYFYLRKHGTNS